MKKTITTIIASIVITVNVNAQWVQQTSGSTQTLNGISFYDDNNGYVVGTAGLGLKTSNGGATWTPMVTGTTNDLHSAKFTALDTGYAAGNAGTIIKTVNGGTSWTILNSGTSAALRFIFFFDANTGFASGASGTILKTTNAGASWSSLNTGSSAVIYGVYFSSSTNGCAVISDGSIIYTSDGGNTWTVGNSGNSVCLYYVYFTSLTTGYAVGDSNVALKSQDGGHTWSPMNLGSVGTNLFCGIKFLNSSIGYISGGDVSANTSRIIKTIDGGTTWSVETTPGNRLARLSFASPNTGYACGLNGTILKVITCTNPLATITPQGNTTFCQGGFVTLNANTGTGYTYQWYVNGSMLSGFINSSYTATQSGNYTVVVSDGACSTTSSATTVTVNPNPTVTLGSIGSFVDDNAATITLSGTPAGGTYSGAVSSSSFNPHAVGLGTKVIHYNYTTGAGCSGNASISTIVYDTTGNVCTTYDTITTYISVTDTLIIHAVLTGISPPNNTNTIKVYPNPASDHINIDFGNYTSMSGYTCSITNTLSQQVFYTLINQQQYYIDLNTWTGHGLYFLTIRNAANTVIEVKKIVIQ